MMCGRNAATCEPHETDDHHDQGCSDPDEQATPTDSAGARHHCFARRISNAFMTLSASWSTVTTARSPTLIFASSNVTTALSRMIFVFASMMSHAGDSPFFSSPVLI